MTDDPLSRARILARLLDSAANIPGTRVRFGLDPIIGLVPGVGDLVGAALSGYIVLLASRLGAPSTVIVRMLGNIIIDTVGGTVPVIGDLFDVGWKSNIRNLTLLERHLGQPESTKRASRAVVWGTVAALALLGVGAAVVGVLILRWIVDAFA